MAATLNLAIWGAVAGLITAIPLSFFTLPPSQQNLIGLVHGHAHPETACQRVWYRTPEFLAVGVIVLFLFLNIVFW